MKLWTRIAPLFVSTLLTISILSVTALADRGHDDKPTEEKTTAKVGKVNVKLIPTVEVVKIGENQFKVYLTEEPGGHGVESAEVMVTAREFNDMDMDESQHNQMSTTVETSFKATNQPGEYSGKIDFDKGGNWEIDVSFMAGDMIGPAEFNQNVVAPEMNQLLLLGLLVTVSLAGVIIVRKLFGKLANGNDLLRYPLIRKAIMSPLFPGVLQAATGIVFGFIVWELLAGPREAHDNFGTALTWVLWWPLIPLLFLFLGRFWCAICPFATLSDLVQKFVGSKRPVPLFLKKYGIWIIDAIFILITWSDHTIGVVENPRGSGVLLLMLTLGVIVTGALFERRTWCRYLCFLGGLSGNYSRSGALELRTNPDICSKCKVQTCYKGGERAPGCPMFEFPRTMDTSASCNLCGYCVKNCPNDSIRISTRTPSSELWSIRKPKFEESFLAAVIMGIVFVQNITMLKAWKPILTWIEGLLGTTNYYITFTLIFAVMMAIPIGALFLVSYLSDRTSKKGVVATFTLFGYALIPLDLAGHLAHNLFHLLAEGKSILYTGLALLGVESHGPTGLVGDSTIQVLQYFLILLGTLGSAYTAFRMVKNSSKKAAIPIISFIVILGLINILLFYLPMKMRM